ncbi:hypothetical protein R4227_10560 [Gordonia amicalis]|uniref:hypothetical protein n=1 Tax=Gordonia amicalis TaxID=89053 RepID=UPI002955C859|nr:hypothetical protein [Gordonia amicalis]MDV7100561.1 hypothetical protein [Gordonia amicalis]
MTDFAAAPFLADLRPFQRRTVDHVVNRFYGTDGTSRFLVADETGLGKSLVARGVIAKTIEELQTDDDVERIDVVYVCSNIDVARQNVNRLNVVGTEVPMSTRLSLLAINADSLDTPSIVGRKPVNLVSLTPRTSFEKGWRTGTADERALIATILGQNVGFDRADWTAIYRILQGSVGSYQRFRDHACAFEAKYVEHLDARIVRRFMKSIRAAGVDRTSPLHRFKTLVAETRGRTVVPGGPAAAAEIIVEFRALLAHAGVDALEPDLIILDEFQRFSDLLDESTEAGELAHQLFNHEDARVLLLSATPFRAFTGPDDAISHHQQFQQTLDFLVRGGTDDAASTRIAGLLDGFRTDVTNGTAPIEQVRTLRDELVQWMSRTERPSADREAMVSESVVGVAPIDTRRLGSIDPNECSCQPRPTAAPRTRTVLGCFKRPRKLRKSSFPLRSSSSAGSKSLSGNGQMFHATHRVRSIDSSLKRSKRVSAVESLLSSEISRPAPRLGSASACGALSNTMTSASTPPYVGSRYGRRSCRQPPVSSRREIRQIRRLSSTTDASLCARCTLSSLNAGSRRARASVGRPVTGSIRMSAECARPFW